MCNLVHTLNHKVFYSLFFEQVSVAPCFHKIGIAGCVWFEGPPPHPSPQPSCLEVPYFSSVFPLCSVDRLHEPSVHPVLLEYFLADLTYVLCPLRAAARPDPLHSPLEQSPSLTDVCRPGWGEWTLASLCACPWSSKCDSTSLSGV